MLYFNITATFFNICGIIHTYKNGCNDHVDAFVQNNHDSSNIFKNASNIFNSIVTYDIIEACESSRIVMVLKVLWSGRYFKTLLISEL